MVEQLRVARRKDLLESIPCNICGGSFMFLHTHLKQAHKLTARKYRDQFGLVNKPLHSEAYAERMRVHSRRPEQVEQSRNLPTEWNESYRRTRQVLAEMGYFVPSIASKVAQIPVTTLYRAMQVGSLSFAEASPLVHLRNRDKIKVIGSRDVMKLISWGDLQEYKRRREFNLLP